MDTTSLINRIAQETGQTKAQTEATVNAALNIICESVASGKLVRLPDFGTFEVRCLSDRKDRNPQAGDPIDDVMVVEFLPAEAFRKKVNNRSD